jgi:hypothetical protein
LLLLLLESFESAGLNGNAGDKLLLEDVGVVGPANVAEVSARDRALLTKANGQGKWSGEARLKTTTGAAARDKAGGSGAPPRSSESAAAASEPDDGANRNAGAVGRVPGIAEADVI